MDEQSECLNYVHEEEDSCLQFIFISLRSFFSEGATLLAAYKLLRHVVENILTEVNAQGLPFHIYIDARKSFKCKFVCGDANILALMATLLIIPSLKVDNGVLGYLGFDH
jgi:hypothetical protein